MAVNIPQVSEVELHEFHQAHFSEHAVAHFQSHFFHPEEKQTVHEDHDRFDEDIVEDDGLGYYPDGVKRTLTDEQIAIFRHSEIEALRRAQNKQATSNSASIPNKDSHLEPQKPATNLQESVNDTLTHVNTASSRIKKSRNKNKQRRREPKPDLRKRTWDVVQPGLDSLEYD